LLRQIRHSVFRNRGLGQGFWNLGDADALDRKLKGDEGAVRQSRTSLSLGRPDGLQPGQSIRRWARPAMRISLYAVRLERVRSALKRWWMKARTLHAPEAERRNLASSERLVRVLGSVVPPPIGNLSLPGPEILRGYGWQAAVS
jgi:hypothetical protein